MLRESLFGTLDPDEALDRLAHHFPKGTAILPIERRIVFGTPEDGDAPREVDVIRELAAELASA